jgi:hypothetical protein
MRVFASTSVTQGTTKTAEAWVVIDKGEINVRSVSPTRIAAIVNWLCTESNLVIERSVSDEAVEHFWETRKGTAKVVPCVVAATG